MTCIIKAIFIRCYESARSVAVWDFPKFYIGSLWKINFWSSLHECNNMQCANYRSGSIPQCPLDSNYLMLTPFVWSKMPEVVEYNYRCDVAILMDIILFQFNSFVHSLLFIPMSQFLELLSLCPFLSQQHLITLSCSYNCWITTGKPKHVVSAPNLSTKNDMDII